MVLEIMPLLVCDVFDPSPPQTYQCFFIIVFFLFVVIVFFFNLE